MTRGPAAAYILVTLLGLFVFFFRLGGCGIFDLDEGLYVEAAREMRMTGDFVTPRVNGQPFFEKPPLIYWLSAGSMSLLGRNEFAARLPSAAASLLTALLILWFGARVFGLRTGTLAACMFTLSPIVFGEGRQLTTDATLTLLITAAVFALFIAWPEDERRQSVRAHTFWALCGFGVLAKGLPGILIPLLTACLFALTEHGWSVREAAKSLQRLRLGTGVLLFLLIAAPWHIAAYKASGEAFTREYIIRQHLGRFRGGDTAHRAPIWFYVPGFMLGMFPWSFFVPAALINLRRAKGHTYSQEEPDRNCEVANAARRLLAIWALLVFVLFSLSGSKLISYILPMYAPAALLAADWYFRVAESSPRATRRIAIALFSSASILFLILLNYRPVIRLIEASTHKAVRMDSITPAMTAFIIHVAGMAALAGLLFLIASRFRRQFAMHALAAGMAGFFGVAIFEGLPAIDSAYLAPLHRLAGVASTRSEQMHWPVIVSSVPGRPSALFYVPDAQLPVQQPKPDQMAQVIGENKSPVVVLTDSGHAQELVRNRKLNELESSGGWTVAESMIPLK